MLCRSAIKWNCKVRFCRSGIKVNEVLISQIPLYKLLSCRVFYFFLIPYVCRHTWCIVLVSVYCGTKFYFLKFMPKTMITKKLCKGWCKMYMYVQMYKVLQKSEAGHPRNTGILFGQSLGLNMASRSVLNIELPQLRLLFSPYLNIVTLFNLRSAKFMEPGLFVRLQVRCHLEALQYYLLYNSIFVCFLHIMYCTGYRTVDVCCMSWVW